MAKPSEIEVPVRAVWVDNDPKRERGWVVKRFQRKYESDGNRWIAAEDEAQDWLRANANHFVFDGFSAAIGDYGWPCIIICGRLT
jgi:hypothetical protein